MKKILSTNELEEQIQKGNIIDVDDIFERDSNIIFNEILDYVSENNSKLRKEARNSINLSCNTKNKVFSNRKPSRDVALVILIDLARFNANRPLCIDDIQRYLKKLGYAQLYVKNSRDCIIYKGICRNESTTDINIAIDLFNENKKFKKLKLLPI